MAFLKGNLYAEGNSEEFFKGRVNPLANKANAEILKVEGCGDCEIELAVGITTVISLPPITGTTTFVFAAPTTGYSDLTGIILQITDGKGGFVTSDMFTVDTTSLDASAEWTITIYIERGGYNKAIDCACSKKFVFPYNPALGYEVNTAELGIALRTMATANGAETEGFNIGSFPAAGSGTRAFDFYLKNTGTEVLTVGTTGVAGDMVSIDQEPIAGVTEGTDIMYPNQVVKWNGVFDDSGLAGSYTAQASITVNGVVFTFDYTFTLV